MHAVVPPLDIARTLTRCFPTTCEVDAIVLRRFVRAPSGDPGEQIAPDNGTYRRKFVDR